MKSDKTPSGRSHYARASSVICPMSILMTCYGMMEWAKNFQWSKVHFGPLMLAEFGNMLYLRLIGLHVHLKDQTWSKAIETCLKNLAYGFCVANYQDLKVLKTITARTCTKFFPVVLVCPFRVSFIIILCLLYLRQLLYFLQ